MEENKNISEEENVHKKAGWIIGIALIIFLILLLGSLIGLKITKNGVDNILDKSNKVDFITNKEQVHYELWENGIKENNDENVTDAEFILDEKIRVSHCNILEMEENFSDIRFDVENMTEEIIEEKTILVKLYDDKENILLETNMTIPELKEHDFCIINSMFEAACANAARVEVSLVEENNNIEE